MGRPVHTAPLALFAVVCFSSCSVGPDYKKPEPASTVPSDWKEGSWKAANPGAIRIAQDWWEIFKDPTLSKLEKAAIAHNQDLKAAVANVDRARAIARVARSEFFPNLGASGNTSRVRASENAAGGSLPQGSGRSLYSSSWSVPLDLSYEIDVFGRVRRSFEAARADAQGALANYGTVVLAITADVATNYYTLRSLDTQLRILRETVELRKESLNLVKSQFDAGAASDFELSQAETELASTQAGVFAVERSRVEVENAIAVLTGRNPAEFELGKLPRTGTPPKIPAGLPSELLERRPDVAQAERAMAASSARIGIAKAAFFPSFSLTGNAGLASASLSDVFRWDSRTWAFGPSIALPLFTGGRNIANLEAAKAEYEIAVAHYRQQVLVAFRDVENALTGIKLLAAQVEAQSRATNSSKRTANISFQRYKEGAVSFRDVVETQRTALEIELNLVRAEADRMNATVALIRSLGGGWPGLK